VLVVTLLVLSELFTWLSATVIPIISIHY